MDDKKPIDDSTYLTAKRTVDDRALNRRVFNRFVDELAARSRTVRILEVGAGTGTMVARLADRGALPPDTVYRLVDRERAHLEHAREHLSEWLEAVGYTVETAAESVETDGQCGGGRDGSTRGSSLGSLHASSGGTDLTVHFEVANAFDIEHEVDAVVACAFFDLVDLPDAVGNLFDLLVEGGLLYAPITFDGTTRFVPAHPLDDPIERCYHRHMEVRDQPGGPKAGRKLIESVPETGGKLLAVGGSDWVIRPIDGTYPHDEQLVLSHLLSTITGAVTAVVSDELDTAHGTSDAGQFDWKALDRWTSLRREQLAEGKLTFVAHNLDVLAAPRTK